MSAVPVQPAPRRRERRPRLPAFSPRSRTDVGESMEVAVERVLSATVVKACASLEPTAALRSAVATLGPMLALRAVLIEWPAHLAIRWGDGTHDESAAVFALHGGGRLSYTVRSDDRPTAAQRRGRQRLVDLTGELFEACDLQQRRIAAERRRERANLAAEVHDEAVQMLFAADLQLRLGDIGEPGERARTLLTRAQGALRSLINDREAPIADLRESLTSAVAALEADFGGHVALKCADDVVARTSAMIADDIDTVVRLVRETALNAFKHGAVEDVSVAIRVSGGDRIVVVVTDGGRGISPSASPSHGLRSVRRAIADSGGSFRIRRRLHGGTAVVATMPL